MDEQVATAAFEKAIKTQKPAFEEFFLARLLDLRFEYPEGQCIELTEEARNGIK